KKKEKLVPLFKQWDLDGVILTHHHEDHTGMAYWIDKHKNIPIHMHQKGVEKGLKKGPLPLYRRIFWGERKAFHAQMIGPEFTTNSYTWDVIHTPGHAEDHLALLNKEKGWLFGGDLYVLANPKSMFSFESVPVLISSLEKVLTYDFDTYICSHVGVINDGRAAIKSKLAYLREIEGKVITLHKKGLKPKEIQKSLFPKIHPLHYLSFFE